VQSSHLQKHGGVHWRKSTGLSAREAPRQSSVTPTRNRDITRATIIYYEPAGDAINGARYGAQGKSPAEALLREAHRDFRIGGRRKPAGMAAPATSTNVRIANHMDVQPLLTRCWNPCFDALGQR